MNLSKEAFCKELEDAIMIGRTDPRRSERNAYIDARLAALDDGDVEVLCKNCGLSQLPHSNFFSQDGSFPCMQCGHKLFSKPLDDGQEGKGLYTEDEVQKIILACWNAARERLEGTCLDPVVYPEIKSLLKYSWPQNWSDDYLKQLKSKRPALPVADGEGEWIELKEGCEMPDYDELVAWASEDGVMFFEMLDKDGNSWIFRDEDDEDEFGKLAKVTHWRKINPPEIGVIENSSNKWSRKKIDTLKRLDESVMETKMLFFKEALEKILNHDKSDCWQIASKVLKQFE